MAGIHQNLLGRQYTKLLYGKEAVRPWRIPRTEDFRLPSAIIEGMIFVFEGPGGFGLSRQGHSEAGGNPKKDCGATLETMGKYSSSWLRFVKLAEESLSSTIRCGHPQGESVIMPMLSRPLAPPLSPISA